MQEIRLEILGRTLYHIHETKHSLDSLDLFVERKKKEKTVQQMKINGITSIIYGIMQW